MADLKTTVTSDYPTTLDTFTTIVDADTRSSDPMNGLADAFVKIETALGDSPHGTKQDVKTYLQVGHKTDGLHRMGLADAYSGTITGTTSETALTYVEIPANTLRTTEIIRITASIAVDYGAAVTLRFNPSIRFGSYTTDISGTLIYSSVINAVVGGSNEEDLYLVIWLFAGNSTTAQESFVEQNYREISSDGGTDSMFPKAEFGRHYNLSEDCSQIRRLYINMIPDDSGITITLKRLNAELFGV